MKRKIDNLHRAVSRFDSLIGAPARKTQGAIQRDRARRQLARRFPVPRPVAAKIEKIVSEIPIHWCPQDKRQFLAHIILSQRLKRTVEIGVFSGASFVAQAVAVKSIGGIAIGIDPWILDEALQTDNRDLLDEMPVTAKDRNWDSIYFEFMALLDRHSLRDSCEIIRETSDQAAQRIDRDIDLLHIDGNHDYDKVKSDLDNYLPKLRRGGYLVMDDINWTTIAPQYELIKSQHTLVYESSTWGCCRKTAALDRPA